MNLIGRVVRFGRYYGWAELLRRILIASTGWLFDNRNVAILMLKPENITFPDAAPEFREITQSNIDEIFKIMYFSREHILDRFHRGERCFAILEEGNIVTYFWAAFHRISVKELHLTVKMRPDQSWFYNAITIKEARGKGYYTNIIRLMAKTLQREGITDIFIYAEEKNSSSMRGIKKAGFIKVIGVEMKRTFSHMQYRLTVFDDAAWNGLSGQIEYPRGDISVHEVIIHGS